MKIVQLAYISLPARDPHDWLKSIDFTDGILKEMARLASIEAIFNIRHKGAITKNNVKYWFTGFSKWQVLLPVQLNGLVKKLNPDVILVHGLISPWQILMLKFMVRSRVKIMVQHHAERPFIDFRKYIQQWADRYISAYLFTSKDLGAFWVNENQIGNLDKIKEVMEGSSGFFPIDRVRARDFTGIRNEKIFLWVGDLTPNKDPLLVARAFIRLLKDVPDGALYMIYQEKYVEADVIKLIHTTGSEKHIHLVGKIKHDELLYWYNSADYIISTSHYEGSGIAVCEAMSCGCIPVLSNIPSFRMMTNQGECGLLFNAGDEEDLLQKLQFTLQLTVSVYREKVLTKFRNDLSFEAIARKTVEVAKEILNEGAR